MKNKLNSLINHIRAIGILQTFSYLFQRITLERGGLIYLKIKGLSSPIFLRNKFYDTHIFYQIFINKEVDFNLHKRPDVIIDCGANIGLSTLYFLKKYPSAKIFSVEPEQSNYHLLLKNTHSYVNVVPIKSAIWKDNKALNIIDDGSGHASFQVAEKLEMVAGIEQIEAITLSTLMQNYNLKYIDLLKIDIEGSEFEIFDSNKFNWNSYVDTLAIEIHESIKPGVTNLIYNTMMDNFDLSSQGEYTLFNKK